MPADDDLYRAAAMPPCDLDDRGLGQRPTLILRAPRLRGNAETGVRLPQRTLLEAWVQFHLIHDRQHTRFTNPSYRLEVPGQGASGDSKQPGNYVCRLL
jgi:hypothetical protein